jgi:hypothetical protein
MMTTAHAIALATAAADARPFDGMPSFALELAVDVAFARSRDGWAEPADPYAFVPDAPKVGDRVRLRSDVERYPHFTAPRGMKGTVVTAAADELHAMIAVRMDEPLPGSEPWQNEIQWSDVHCDPTNNLDADPRVPFWQDCALIVNPEDCR